MSSCKPSLRVADLEGAFQKTETFIFTFNTGVTPVKAAVQLSWFSPYLDSAFHLQLACEHQQEIIRHLCVAVTCGCLTLMAQHSSTIHKLSPSQLGNAQRTQTI